jgi:hypothetical protein
VDGTRGTYEIDLGTGNVLFEPSGRWLAFPPAMGSAASIVSMSSPVTDDEVLDRIIERATLLAQDDSITSKKFLKQLL